jgi:hypothetical protein
MIECETEVHNLVSNLVVLWVFFWYILVALD